MIVIRFGLRGASVSFSDSLQKFLTTSVFLLGSDDARKISSGKKCNIFYLKRDRFISLLFSAFRIAKILFKSKKSALVLMPSPYDWLLVFKRGGAKSVFVIVHDHETHKGDSKIREFLAQSYWKICRPNIICLSEFVANSLRSQNYEITSVIQHPYFDVCDEIKRTSSSDDKLFDFGFFGRLKSYQSPDIMQKLVDVIKKKRANLIVCGGGEGLSIESGPYVHRVYGGIDDYTFFKTMAQTKCLILPYSEATQSGIIPNALALGCRIITTAVGGIPEQDIFANFIYATDFSLESIEMAINKFVSGEIKSGDRNSDTDELNVISPQTFALNLFNICHGD